MPYQSLRASDQLCDLRGWDIFESQGIARLVVVVYKGVLPERSDPFPCSAPPEAGRTYSPVPTWDETCRRAEGQSRPQAKREPAGFSLDGPEHGGTLAEKRGLMHHVRIYGSMRKGHSPL